MRASEFAWFILRVFVCVYVLCSYIYISLLIFVTLSWFIYMTISVSISTHKHICIYLYLYLLIYLNVCIYVYLYPHWYSMCMCIPLLNIYIFFHGLLMCVSWISLQIWITYSYKSADKPVSAWDGKGIMKNHKITDFFLNLWSASSNVLKRFSSWREDDSIIKETRFSWPPLLTFITFWRYRCFVPVYIIL